jgi:hypothetical protein
VAVIRILLNVGSSKPLISRLAGISAGSGGTGSSFPPQEYKEMQHKHTKKLYKKSLILIRFEPERHFTAPV